MVINKKDFAMSKLSKPKIKKNYAVMGDADSHH